jgi:c(7)-type cytochrome triheme protein
MKKMLSVLALILVVSAPIWTQTAGPQTAGKKRRPLPYEYGRVVINTYSGKAGLPPAVFEHWIHRTKFTCRLCHVDVGFAMKEGETGIKAADNMRGFYCGACHNGKTLVDGIPLFEACSDKATEDDQARCVRCHSSNTSKSESDFVQFAKTLPKERFGNGVDWQQAEEMGIINPVDFVKGISIRRKSLTVQNDFMLNPKVAGMPDIIFSHKKHTVWNGCELCHPEIFVGVKKGTTRYSMVGIFEGKYCGVCHNTVAFPLLDCQRCHSRPVQP